MRLKIAEKGQLLFGDESVFVFQGEAWDSPKRAKILKKTVNFYSIFQIK
jgi:hypothetical protein